MVHTQKGRKLKYSWRKWECLKRTAGQYDPVHNTWGSTTNDSFKIGNLKCDVRQVTPQLTCILAMARILRRVGRPLAIPNTKGSTVPHDSRGCTVHIRGGNGG